MRLIATLCLMVCLLAACGSAPDYHESEPGSNMNTGDITEHPTEPGGENGIVPGEYETDPSDSPDPNDDSHGREEEGPDKNEETVAKNYYMNKNYFIKPKDPDGNSKVVLLTFDDGPKKEEMLRPMLDTLDKHQAKAIFFVNGYRVKANPELLKMIDEADQIIGNHSWDHIELGKENKEKIDQQVEDTQAYIQEIVGYKPLFFRPPYASSNDYLKEKVKAENMLYMTWSNGSLDWDKNNESAEKVIFNVFDQLHPGSNILMHELPWTVEALDELLTKLEAAGYGFVDPRAIDPDYVEPDL